MKLKTTIPQPLPLRDVSWEALVGLIGHAHAQLARFDEVTSSVLDPEAVFSLLTFQEVLDSVESQKMTFSMEELLYAQAVGENEIDNPNIKALLNYQEALFLSCKKNRKMLPSSSFICKLHRIIKKDSGDDSAEMGRFRKRQNWIGPEGCTIEEAYFYPPVCGSVHKYMDQLRGYLDYKEKDPLVQLAIYFAQLLIVHPFMDGNGRVARSLIPLFLCQKKLLSSPLFFMSSYFKRHRLAYFEKLFAITSEKRWMEWIEFFLKGIIEESSRNLKRARLILDLHHTFVCAVGESLSARKVIDQLFAHPILDVQKLPHSKEMLRVLSQLKRKGLIMPYIQKPPQKLVNGRVQSSVYPIKKDLVRGPFLMF